MQVIITMAGKGSRFSESGYTEPKPVVNMAGKPAIEYLVDAFPKEWNLIFAVGAHYKGSIVEKVLRNIRPEAQIIFSEHTERGPIDTVKAALPILNSNDPVMVSYCDYSLVWDPNDFLRVIADYDAAVVSYLGFHPTYFGPNSYCHLQVDGNRVTKLQEKVLFTDDIEKEVTSVGLYYFKNLATLVSALNEQEVQDLKYKTEFYTSLAIQALMNSQPEVKVLNYIVEHMVQTGTPSDTERFEFWHSVLIQNQEPGEFKFQHIIKEKQPTSFTPALFELEKVYWQKTFSELLDQKK
ncbi:MAG: NTP transferase domain-containing protein [Bdellovibrionaceae bacterium]|nr:NTP transferase domain-containing protein [Bdellovibrio sp.]